MAGHWWGPGGHDDELYSLKIKPIKEKYHRHGLSTPTHALPLHSTLVTRDGWRGRRRCDEDHGDEEQEGRAQPTIMITPYPCLTTSRLPSQESIRLEVLVRDKEGVMMGLGGSSGEGPTMVGEGREKKTQPS